MKQEIINLVDKVVGKKGIMRSPAWWVNRIFKKTLDYSDKVAKDAESRVNSKIDALEAGKEDKIMSLYVPEFMGDSYKSWMQDENKRLYDEIIAGRCYMCKIVSVTKTSDGLYHIGTPTVFLGSVFISSAFPFEWSTSDDVLELYAREIFLKSDGSVEVFQNTNIPVLTRKSIIDNLDSNSGDYALSAKQGKVLKEYVDSTIAQAITTTLNTAV